MAKRIDFRSLLADGFESDLWLHKEAQEQPDETQFAQDFANLAFQFMQDRAPAMMKYILGFEVVDRAENGTRAVGIFGFKIDGDYYYVPAFFMNSQVKGIDSILSKRTNSFVPLTEEWVNYIINRRANELGEEAPKEDTDSSADGQAAFENPNFDFLRRPTVGPLGGPRGFKVAEDQTPWTFKQAWDAMTSETEEKAAWDPEFKESFVGFLSAMNGIRSPMKKSASSPIQDYILKIGGPKSERTLMEALKNVKMANAALEFYTGPAAFHVDSYPNRGRDCYLLRKAAEEISERAPKVKITSDSSNDEEAREIIEDGFTVQDYRKETDKSDVVETDYEQRFQNPDKPGAYDVLVTGGVTRRAYVFTTDRIFHKGQAGAVAVYFPDNRQVIYTKNRNVWCEGGCRDGSDSVYGKASDVGDCELRSEYLFVSRKGMALPGFDVTNVKRDKGERPVLLGSFRWGGPDYGYEDSDDDFSNYWKGDRWHELNGLVRSGVQEWSVVDVELAGFKGDPKVSGSSVLLPSDWKAFKIGDKKKDKWGYDVPVDRVDDKVVYRLGDLDSLTNDLRKAGAAKLDVRTDDIGQYYYSFDGGPYTRSMPYKQASIDFVTRLGMRYSDARRLLKRASVERKAVCLVKMAQMVGVSPNMPPDQTPGSDPYTGIPTFQTPYVDTSTMPFNGVELPPQDNPYGENLGGEISRQSEQAGDGSGEAQFDEEAAGLAEDAGRLGQKHVFDKAAIGGLAKVYDTGAVIDSYIPEFLQSVDRLGRVLFLYYWKHNDFIERYGTDDVIEMEDVLRGTFKQLGKLTLDLKRKAVGGGDADASIDTIGA